MELAGNIPNTMSRCRTMLRDVLPPVLMRLLRRHLQVGIVYRYGYENWREAVKASSGYSADNIIEAVTNSARMVRDGWAAYERDGVVFNQIDYSWPLLASLLLCAADKGCLRVVDFGGGLGTSYRQNKAFLDILGDRVNWRIVEQRKLVSIGNAEFTSGNLSFHLNLRDACAGGVDLVLFGSSLCYLDDPFGILSDVIDARPDYIVFDRTPLNSSAENLIAVQIVSSKIYRAKYPIWNFSREKFFQFFSGSYRVMEEWQAQFQTDPKAQMSGVIFRRWDLCETVVQ